MTAYEWTLIALTALGVAITCGGVLFGFGRYLGEMKKDFAQQLGSEVVARTKAIADAVVEREEALKNIRAESEDRERQMEDHFREVAMSLRTFIETVEKDIRRVEMSVVQNFVPKDDFNRAIGMLSKSMDAGIVDIKVSVGKINERLDRWIEKRAGLPD